MNTAKWVEGQMKSTLPVVQLGNGRFYEDFLIANQVALLLSVLVLQSLSLSFASSGLELRAADGGPGNAFGVSVAVEGDFATVGAPGDTTAAGFAAGSAYLFGRSGTNWIELAKLTASDAAPEDEFGYSVGIASNTVVVGAVANEAVPAQPVAGAVYVFEWDGTNCIQQAKLIADNPQAQGYNEFGFSVAVSGDTIVAGPHTLTLTTCLSMAPPMCM